MIVELILLGSLIGGLGSDNKKTEEPTGLNSPSASVANSVRSAGSQGAALKLVPVQSPSLNSEESKLTKEVVVNLSAKPQNMDEVLRGFASDCALGLDAIDNLKRMAEGQDSLFSPFVKPEKLEVNVEVAGAIQKGYAFAMEQSYLGIPLVSMYALKGEGGALTAGLITSSSIDKAYEAFLAELPSGVLQRLKIENHPTEKNLVELICSL